MEDFDSGEIVDVYDEIGDEKVYSRDGRETLIDDEELSSVEDAFMEGYEMAFD